MMLTGNWSRIASWKGNWRWSLEFGSRGIDSWAKQKVGTQPQWTHNLAPSARRRHASYADSQASGSTVIAREVRIAVVGVTVRHLSHLLCHRAIFPVEDEPGCRSENVFSAANLSCHLATLNPRNFVDVIRTSTRLRKRQAAQNTSRSQGGLHRASGSHSPSARRCRDGRG